MSGALSLVSRVWCRCLWHGGARHEVPDALSPCAKLYLKRVLAQSPARVVFVVGAQAAAALEAEFRIQRDGGAALLGPTRLAGVDRLLVFVPNPGRRRYVNEEVFKAFVLPDVVSSGDLATLRKTLPT